MSVETKTASQKLNREGRKVEAIPRHALIVDAEPGTCAVLREVLSAAGMEGVTVAESAEAAVHARERKFDVVVVDVITPASEGIELTRQIRVSGFNQMTPIILIGDKQRPGGLAQGFAAGASFFVHKPMDRARLIKLFRVIQGAIEQERRRFRRIPLRVKVRLKSTNAQLEGETIDVSMNGALIRVPRTFPQGSAVEISLYLLPGEKPVIGSGFVRRVVGSDQLGIQLNRFSVAESGRLQEYLLPFIQPV
jgi:DNA-binding response OmpR family regulator